MKISYSNASIGSVEKLAKTLGVSEIFLHQVAQNTGDYYSISQIPKKNGELRTISDPVKELKIVQRRIVRRILSKCSFPNYLFGSIKNDENPRDFVRNAKFHGNAKEVMAFDIDSFFPSTSPALAKKVFKYLLRLPSEVADLLVSLTTLNNCLPQGAPSSPYIANLVFYDSEHKLVKVLHSKGLIYSRLVDDITVSSKNVIKREERSFIYNSIQSFLSEKGYAISKRKYKVTNTGTSGSKTIVTGLVIESGIVKLPKEKIKLMGSCVYELKNQSAVDKTNSEYHNLYGSTSGLVALYKRLDPIKSASYRSVLSGIKPIYSSKKVKKICSLCKRFAGYAKSHPTQLADEGYARKYYSFKHKISIIRRTNRKLAITLDKELKDIKPLFLLSSYHE